MILDYKKINKNLGLYFLFVYAINVYFRKYELSEFILFITSVFVFFNLLITYFSSNLFNDKGNRYITYSNILHIFISFLSINTLIYSLLFSLLLFFYLYKNKV